MSRIIEITDGIARQVQYRLARPINLSIESDEQIAILGDNGAGKSIIARILAGEIPLQGVGVRYNFGSEAPSSISANIVHLAFRDSYGAADKGYYHQQRWNATDREGQPTVREKLDLCQDSALRATLFSIFDIDSILDKELILLSSGELRRYQIVRALSRSPRILIIEDPFIGLDPARRQTLRTLLSQLVQSTNIQIILVLSKSCDIPQFITHIIPIEQGICCDKIAYNQCVETKLSNILPPDKRTAINSLPQIEWQHASGEVLSLDNVSIKYGEHTILKDVNWKISCGEKWALSGENGAGKSTLLSLICADIPQGYACSISRFGQKQGAGVSIWDIKRNIGYVSPEMHRAYCEPLPCVEIAASGLRDTVGLFKKMADNERDVALFWLDIFGIKGLSERRFTEISSGEQRLVLLARAFVKCPDLLILDEPLHGLDEKNRRLVLDIVECYTALPNKTLIYVTHYAEELPSTITSSFRLVKHQENL